MTCRQRKVKCDEGKPVCGRCIKIFRQCNWEQPSAPTSDYTFKLLYQARRNFGTGSFNIDAMVPYIHYFTTFCCRFLAYPNVWGNPFERYLVPLAATSPALLYSMAAVAASHWDRYQEKHTSTAVNYYSTAVSELRDSLADTTITELDSTLGACLLLCVYEVKSLKRYPEGRNCLSFADIRSRKLFMGYPSPWSESINSSSRKTKQHPLLNTFLLFS